MAEDITGCLPEKLSKALICVITSLGFVCPLLLRNGFEYLRETFADQIEEKECDETHSDTASVQKIFSNVFRSRKQVTK